MSIPLHFVGPFSKFNVPKNAKIIDVGGGDSLLIDHLLDLDYTDLTVLDISLASLQKAQKRFFFLRFLCLLAAKSVLFLFHQIFELPLVNPF